MILFSLYFIQVEGQLFELEQLQQQLPLLEHATAKLEDLVGSSTAQLDISSGGPAKSQQYGSELPHAETLSARLEVAVESASLVAAELQSIHRQHITTGLLLQQEQVRTKQLEADLAEGKVSSHCKMSCHYCWLLSTLLL